MRAGPVPRQSDVAPSDRTMCDSASQNPGRCRGGGECETYGSDWDACNAEGYRQLAGAAGVARIAADPADDEMANWVGAGIDARWCRCWGNVAAWCAPAAGRAERAIRGSNLHRSVLSEVLAEK